ncbi:ABC transporter permease [Rhodococcus opacus]|nr:ABC transporter permease [Rhodococcus opacus]
MLFVAVFAPLLSPFDPTAQDLKSRLLPPGSMGSHGTHLMGTDGLGRDVFSMILAGTPYAVGISVAAVILAGATGTLVGAVTGFIGGRLGSAMVFVTNVQLSIPAIMLAIAVVGILTPSVPLVIVVIAFGVWVPFARISYAETQRIRDLEYIEAVRVMRGSTVRIIRSHILPNIVPHVLVMATLCVGLAVLAEASLSFVGLGAPTASPTWGLLLSQGRQYISTAWWLAIFPGLAIFLLVFAVSVIGEQVRDLKD